VIDAAGAPSGIAGRALIHERLAVSLAAQSALRLLEPPMALEPITQVAIWPTRIDSDAAHRWLRERMARLVDELDSAVDARDGADLALAGPRLVRSGSGR